MTMTNETERLRHMARETGRGSSPVMERIYLGAFVSAIYMAYTGKQLDRLAHFIEVRRIRAFLASRPKEIER